jgi:hypothetical protein
LDGSDHETGEADRKANGSDRIKPWTIKGVAPEERNAAIAAADRADQNIGVWLGRAIRLAVQADQSRPPVPVQTEETDRPADLSDLERMVAMAQQLATASGRPPPRTVSGLAYKVIRQRLEGMTKAPPGRTVGRQSDQG